MVKEAPRGVQPREVQLAVHLFFGKFLLRAEKERRRRGIEGELSAFSGEFAVGQLPIFELDFSCKRSDEYALPIRERR